MKCSLHIASEIANLVKSYVLSRFKKVKGYCPFALYAYHLLKHVGCKSAVLQLFFDKFGRHIVAIAEIDNKLYIIDPTAEQYGIPYLVYDISMLKRYFPGIYKIAVSNNYFLNKLKNYFELVEPEEGLALAEDSITRHLLKQLKEKVGKT